MVGLAATTELIQKPKMALRVIATSGLVRMATAHAMRAAAGEVLLPEPMAAARATAALGRPAAAARCWEDANYSYAGDAPHAVTSVERGEVADVYEYDEAGNMVCRIEDGQTWIQSYNSANRMNKVEKVPGDCDTPGTPESTWTFYYDGDGNRIKQANPDGSTTLFLMGGMYIVDVPASGPAEATKYYSIAGQRIAMEVGSSGVQYLLTDHLGSVSAVLNASGQLLEDKEQRYMPFGMPRVNSAELGRSTHSQGRNLTVTLS